MIAEITKKFWKPISITYLFIIIENVLSILLPFYIGETIDKLMNKSLDGLIVYLAVFSTWIAIGFFRRIYDTRTFMNINAFMVTKIVNTQNKNNVDLSKITARVSLSSSFISFLEVDVGVITAALFSIIGSLYMIYNLSLQVFVYSVIFIIPMIFVLIVFKKRLEPLIKKINSSHEQTVSSIETRKETVASRHFNVLAKRSIRISDNEAMHYLISSLLMLSLLFFSLSSFQKGIVSAGILVSIFQYLNKFVLAIDDIPYIIQQIVHIKDVQSRL